MITIKHTKMILEMSSHMYLLCLPGEIQHIIYSMSDECEIVVVNCMLLGLKHTWLRAFIYTLMEKNFDKNILSRIDGFLIFHGNKLSQIHENEGTRFLH